MGLHFERERRGKQCGLPAMLQGFYHPITSLTLCSCKLSPCHIRNAQVGAFPSGSEMIDSLGSYLFIFHAVRGTSHQGLPSRLDDSASVLARAEFPKHWAMEKCPLERALPHLSSAPACEFFVLRGPVEHQVLCLTPSICETQTQIALSPQSLVCA